MAIQKSKTLENGAIGNYWKIRSAELNKQNMTLTVSMALFADAAHKNAEPLGGFKSFCFHVDANDAKGDIVSFAYDSIKESNILRDKDGNQTGYADDDFGGGSDV